MIGVVINTGTALLFVRGRDHDLNLRGAYLHMAADALAFAGRRRGRPDHLGDRLQWVDPVTSLIIAAVILVSTWGLLRGILAVGDAGRSLSHLPRMKWNVISRSFRV